MLHDINGVTYICIYNTYYIQADVSRTKIPSAAAAAAGSCDACKRDYEFMA